MQVDHSRDINRPEFGREYSRTSISSEQSSSASTIVPTYETPALSRAPTRSSIAPSEAALIGQNGYATNGNARSDPVTAALKRVADTNSAIIQKKSTAGISTALVRQLQDSMGEVHWLVARGDEEGLANLLRGKSKVNDTKRPLKVTPLHVAAITGRDNMARLLLSSGATVDAKDALKRTPLHWAALAPPSGVTQILLNAGAGVDQVDEAKKTALHHAATSNNRSAAGQLIQKGHPVNIRDAIKLTPLHAAASSGSIDVTRLLVANGAEVNAAEVWGRTPLHWAAYANYVEVGEILLDGGALINVQDPQTGRTPLHEAAFWARGPFITMLLQRGADTERITRYGELAAKLASKWRRPELDRLFDGY